MTTTLVLEPTNDSDLHLLLSLAQRLGVKATASPAANLSLEERERRFMALFGSWQSDETGDEINKMLRESRQSNRPDIELRAPAICSTPTSASTFYGEKIGLTKS